MTAPLHRAMLTTHVVVSVSWGGALLVFLAHCAASLTWKDPVAIRAACLAMVVTAWAVILPLSIATLVTGVIQAVGTAWGLVRHYWLVVKLALTALATTVLLLKLPVISAMTSVEGPQVPSLDLRVSLTLHAVGGWLVLLACAVLAVYKPPGRTFWSSGKAAVPAPFWVKATFVVATLALFAVLAMLALGGHGPGMHGVTHR